jgi:hypothetical protein
MDLLDRFSWKAQSQFSRKSCLWSRADTLGKTDRQTDRRTIEQPVTMPVEGSAIMAI